MDENLKHLSKPAKKLLLLLRTKYHESPGIDNAWLSFPDIEQAMGIDWDAVRALTNELIKYDYVHYSLNSRPEAISKLKLSQDALSAAEQLVLWNRIKRKLRPVWSHTMTFVLGIAVTIAGYFVITHLQTTDSQTSDSDNANSEQAAPERPKDATKEDFIP